MRTLLMVQMLKMLELCLQLDWSTIADDIRILF